MHLHWALQGAHVQLKCLLKWKRCILRMQMYFRMRKPKVMQSKPQTESSVPARWHDCLRPPTTQKVSILVLGACNVRNIQLNAAETGKKCKTLSKCSQRQSCRIK